MSSDMQKNLLIVLSCDNEVLKFNSISKFIHYNGQVGLIKYELPQDIKVLFKNIYINIICVLRYMRLFSFKGPILWLCALLS